MAVTYFENQKTFKLDTPNTSYIMGIQDQAGYLLHYYYGKKLNQPDVSHLARTWEPPYTPERNDRDKLSFLDAAPFEYPTGGIGFWPGAAWIASSNADYDWDGSVGSTLEFQTAYVQWPVGPSGSAETNKGKLTSGSFWFIPNGIENPELVYNAFEALSNWYLDDVSVRDDQETMWWWYATTASDPDIQVENFETMFDIGSREQFDVYQSLGVAWDLEALIFVTMTAAQFQETYRQEFQAAIDAYFG